LFLKVTNENPEIFHKEVIFSLEYLLKNTIIYLVIFFGCTPKDSFRGYSRFQRVKITGDGGDRPPGVGDTIRGVTGVEEQLRNNYLAGERRGHDDGVAGEVFVMPEEIVRSRGLSTTHNGI
jgi:hypothetical protein